MVVSLVGYYEDGSTKYCHLNSELLSVELQNTLEKVRKLGIITQVMLDTFFEHKIHYQMLIDDQIEVDVKD
jgi:hypothetical protein